MKTVITYGTFDLFHIGHVNLLKRAKSLGDRLIVGVSTDEFNQSKGKTTLVPYAHRAAILESCRYVDLIIPEQNWQQKRPDIVQHNVDIFLMGDDWRGKFDELSDLCQVIYLDRTKDISSTAMKQAINVFVQMQKDFL
ncbi:glycerol-3-phosphate cytidylyltransferase [Alkalimonas delamerensis]|uniref:Glycerol-3-phosphate cytidylyltransferase n=1 Tax=Alkalimonas delamerensis TaxID=265981 RepID=A0ABT9GMY5_9GAMM|nr:glycerol-3-phosphate cytidylyltransferase [Alkalimonas delamerensis]MDP4528330.1 glycerol-3-phosphate cytidylyltransferase [Alkalimonas delamerensis]